MNEEKKQSIEQMFTTSEKVKGVEIPENPESEIGKPQQKTKWPIVLFVISVFLFLIIGALVVGFFVFL